MKDLEKWVVDPSAPFLWPSICPLVSLVVRVILSHDLLPQSPGNRTEGEGLETEVIASLQSPCNSSKEFAVFGKSFPFLFHFFTPLYVFNENNEIQTPTSFFTLQVTFCFSENVCIMEVFKLILYHLKIYHVFLHFLLLPS